MSDNSFFYPPAQPANGNTKLVGDMVSGMPDVLDNPVVPIRKPLECPPTIGDLSAQARIVGDMVSGQTKFTGSADAADQVTGTASKADIPRRQL